MRPRSSLDSNSDGVGDINGLRDRLAYLVWLGVEAIWISPFYPSQMHDFGHDVPDSAAIGKSWFCMAKIVLAGCASLKPKAAVRRLMRIFGVTNTSCVAVAFCAMLASSPSARAEVRITGDAKALQVEVKNESIEALLAALKNSVGLQYQLSAPLDQHITGHFEGSLEQIISTLLFLNDYNYVFMKTAEGPTLVIFAASAESADATGPRMPAPPPLPGAAQQRPNLPQFPRR